jgi:hypothetical protein
MVALVLLQPSQEQLLLMLAVVVAVGRLALLLSWVLAALAAAEMVDILSVVFQVQTQ